MIDYRLDFQNVFEPTAAGFSARNAHCLALAAKLAYSGASEVHAITSDSWGFDPARFRFFDDGDTQGFAAMSGTMRLLAFRGTQSVHDWLFNLDTAKDGGPAGEVHRGFQRAWRKVAEPVKQHLTAGQGLPLWITGHSLGGAIARLCAAELELRDGVPVSGVYTFGQPRVGDEGFMSACEQRLGGRTFRYVHDNDIVPHVPPHSFGFRHEERRVFINPQHQAHSETDQTEQTLNGGNLLKKAGVVAQEAARFTGLKTRNFEGVEDHAMEHYIAGAASQL